MPTNRTRRSRSRSTTAGIGEADFEFFTAGDFFEAEGYADDKTEDELKSFWIKHRSTIMERYLDNNRLKKRIADRPWSFWKWDAPEPQKEIAPMKSDSQRRWDHQRHGYFWVEDDIEYLSRLGLLEPWELELLKDGK
jgi:hypothetical protein